MEYEMTQRGGYSVEEVELDALEWELLRAAWLAEQEVSC